MNQPTVCRPEAFHYFAHQLRNLNTTEGLLRSAIGISLHAFDDVDPKVIELRLRRIADRVLGRVRGDSRDAVWAHLHQVLFDEEGFCGNPQQYYSTLNSYLPAVLETRQGIPITLCLVYKYVGEQCGLEIEGVNAPGHFLARVKGDPDVLVDPFFGGKIVDREEALSRVAKIVGQPEHADRYLTPATHGQWIGRMLSNLQHIFAVTRRHADLAAMTELQSLLDDCIF